MGLIASGRTDIGLKRSSNQDSIFYSIDQRLFLVADGMGGHSGGDIASQMCVKDLPNYLEQDQTDTPELDLKAAIERVNKDIFDYAKGNDVMEGMGTTATAILFRDGVAYVANVGDSRAYLIQKGRLYQLTRDHSLVQEKLKHGIYTREDAVKDQMKNVLVRSVGIDQLVEVDVFEYKVHQNDLFIICSDGLHGKVSDQAIVEKTNEEIQPGATATAENMGRLVDKLINQANANGGNDNISVILVQAQ